MFFLKSCLYKYVYVYVCFMLFFLTKLVIFLFPLLLLCLLLIGFILNRKFLNFDILPNKLIRILSNCA